MSDDERFRLILLAGFLILIPLGAWNRLKAHTGEKLDRRQEGWFILITLRLVGVVGILSLIAYLINPGWMAWASLPLPTWLRWVGVGLGVITGLLLVWTLRTLGTNITDTVVTRQQHTLVTTGPYRWVRHPFYSTAGLSILANTFTAANWFFLAMGGAMFVLLAIRCRKEEENLIARFGDDYRKMIERTGRFLPWW